MQLEIKRNPVLAFVAVVALLAFIALLEWIGSAP